VLTPATEQQQARLQDSSNSHGIIVADAGTSGKLKVLTALHAPKLNSSTCYGFCLCIPATHPIMMLLAIADQLTTAAAARIDWLLLLAAGK
jgi:hypothetical protein